MWFALTHCLPQNFPTNFFHSGTWQSFFLSTDEHSLQRDFSRWRAGNISSWKLLGVQPCIFWNHDRSSSKGTPYRTDKALPIAYWNIWFPSPPQTWTTTDKWYLHENLLNFDARGIHKILESCLAKPFMNMLAVSTIQGNPLQYCKFIFIMEQVWHHRLRVYLSKHIFCSQCVNSVL